MLRDDSPMAIEDGGAVSETETGPDMELELNEQEGTAASNAGFRELEEDEVPSSIITIMKQKILR